MSQQVVAAVKADLEARGVSLVGPDGAFAIVLRVAWTLRATGAGLLSKPGGHHAEWPIGSGQFFATDIIAFPDGTIFDVLASGGGEEYPPDHPLAGQPIPGTGNGPVWNPPSDGQPVDPSRYRRPLDPGDDAPAPVGVGVPGAPALPAVGEGSAHVYAEARVLEWFQKSDAHNAALLDRLDALVAAVTAPPDAVIVPPWIPRVVEVLEGLAKQLELGRGYTLEFTTTDVVLRNGSRTYTGTLTPAAPPTTTPAKTTRRAKATS